MSSVIEICNSGLNMLGANNITSLTEDSKNARLCNQRFNSVRDSVFREHLWNCLIKRVQLPLESEKPAHEYVHQYTLPSDCIRVIRIGGTADGSSSDLNGGQFFKVEGRKILTNEDTVYLLYVARITDPNEYDTLLVETLATRLAAELAYAITNSNPLANSLKIEYKDKLSIARHTDASEGSADYLDSSSYINARY